MSEPSTKRMQTRPANANKHPGTDFLSPKRKRRSTEEVTRDKRHKAEEKDRKKEEKQIKINRIAALEDKMAEEDAHVSDAPSRPRPRPRPAQNIVEDSSEPEQSTAETEGTNRGSETVDIEETPRVSKKQKISTKEQIKAARKAVPPQGQVEPGHGARTGDKAIDKAPKPKSRDAPQDSNKMAASQPAPAVRSVIKDWVAGISPNIQVPTKSTKNKGLKAPASVTSSTVAASTTRKSKTTSSSVVEISGTSAPASTIAINEVGGLFDEDEDDERDAALSSPIKGHKRVTSSGLVAIQSNDPPLKKMKTEKSGRATTKATTKLNNSHLPDGCQDGNRWRRSFVPTYISFVASYDNPWTVADADAVPAMQAIWNKVYDNPKITHEIEAQQAVFCVAEQRVYEWRATFGSAACNLMDLFFETSNAFNSTDDCKEFAEELLEHERFLYSNTESDDPDEYRGAFASHFVLQTFAAHFTAIRGSIEIPKLKISRPKVAIALAAAAVKRALTMWKSGDAVLVIKDGKKKAMTSWKALNQATGRESNKTTVFGDANWGSHSRTYFTALNDFRDTSIDKLVQKARKLAKNSGGTGKMTASSNTDITDDRPRIRDLSDDSDNGSS